MLRMEYLEFFLYLMGFSMLVYGFVTLKLKQNLQARNSFWAGIDNARAKKEVHEFGMFQASMAIKGLIYISAAILICGLAFALSFSNLLLDHINSYKSVLYIENAIFGAQILTFIALVVFSAMILASIIFSRLERSLNLHPVLIASLIFALAIVVLYIIFVYIIPATANINEVVEPIFTMKFQGDWHGLLRSFSISILLLVYPVLIFLLVAYVAAASIDELPFIRSSDMISRVGRYFPIVLVFIVGFIGSVFYTLLSGVIGTSIGEVDGVRVSIQLVLANAVCDGLTLYVTAALLMWAGASWRCRRNMTSIELQLKRPFARNYRDDGVYFLDSEKLSYIKKVIDKLRNASEVETDDLKVDFGSYSYGITSPINSLKNLANIFGYKDIYLFDRLLYKRVIAHDEDISLINAGASSANHHKTFDPNQSWVLNALEVISEDMDEQISVKEAHAVKKIKQWRDEHQDLIGTDEQYSHERFLRRSYGKSSIHVDSKKFDRLLGETWVTVDHCRKNFRFRPIIAIISDMLLAALFAFLSITLGLLGSGFELRFEELLGLFFGGFEGGQFTNIGPLFWVMHTTFIPSIILWLILVILMISAFIISPSINFVAGKLSSPNDSKLHPEILAQVSVSKTGSLLIAFASLLKCARAIIY